MVRLLIVPLACDLAEQGARLGPETLERCYAAHGVFAREHFVGNRNCTIALSAGMADQKKFPAQTDTMARMMGEYFTRRRVPEKQVAILPSTWGTIGELARAVRFAREFGFYHVHVVTSWYHIPRVRLILRDLGKALDAENLTYSWSKVKGKRMHALIEGVKLPVHVLRRSLKTI